jgi:predicted PurR-regulated permease PerM
MTDYTLKTRSYRSDIVFVFALAIAGYVAWLAREVLLLLYVSWLFSVIFRPIVESVGRFHIGRWRPFRGIAILVLLGSAAAVLIAFGFFALPPVIRDLQEFSKAMPARTSFLMEKLKRIPFADQVDPDVILTRLQDMASNAATYLVVSVRDWAGKVFEVFMGFILTIYFILDGDNAYRWFLSFFPPESRERFDLTMQRAEVRMGRWLLGQGSLMLILGLTSTIVYLALKVRYAYALGALAGLMNIIPVIGAIVSVVLGLLVASLDSWGRVLGVAIFYAVYLQIENSFLTPRIMKNWVGLPGLAILVALLLGSSLAGIAGALVAVPTGVLAAELINEYLVNKNSTKPATPETTLK